MQTSTFNAGLRMGQMIHLLTPAGRYDKPFCKALARLRSHLESLVVGATVDGELGEQASRAINAAEDALASSMARLLWTKTSIDYRRQTCNGLLQSTLEALNAGPNLQALNAKTKTRRADLLHTYASLVRNSGWLPTLMRLKLNPSVATLRGADLLAHYSSTTGRARLQDNLKKFALTDDPAIATETLAMPKATSNARGRKAKPLPEKVNVAGRFATQVVLLPEAFADPLIASLTALRHPDPAQRPAEDRALARLLETASKPAPVKEGQAPEVVAQSVFDALVNALRERQKALEAAGVKLRAAAERAAEAQAIEELKKLDPKLLKLLKNKPDLLNTL